MQVMVTTKAVDIDPALQMSVDLAIDSTVFYVAHHGMVGALARPRQRGIFRGQQFTIQVIRSLIRSFGIKTRNFICQCCVNSVVRGKPSTHQPGGLPGRELWLFCHRPSGRNNVLGGYNYPTKAEIGCYS